MELSERKKAILSAIVEMYIRSGEPVGSKLLCSLLQNAPSSATLRNEMNALCDMGFLAQTHTSSGRVPTSNAYRLYINNLMAKGSALPENKEVIDLQINSSNCDPEGISERAVETLSHITGLPAFALKFSNTGVTLKRVELFPMGMHSAMLIIITSDGRTYSRLCGLDAALTSGVISEFDSLVTGNIKNKNIHDLTPAATQSLIARSGSNILSFMPLVTALFQIIEDIKNSRVNVKGFSNLFSMGLDPETAEKVRCLISNQEAVMNIISNAEGPLNIVFGDDTGYNALKSYSIILAKYSLNGRFLGCIGVIGPKRMSYEQIIPSVEYTANRITCLLESTFKDMEEQI